MWSSKPATCVQVGVLALPYTFSYLTWTGGLIALSLSAAVSMYTSYLLAAMHQDEQGTRHNRYLDLGKHVYGEAPAHPCYVFRFRRVSIHAMTCAA